MIFCVKAFTILKKERDHFSVNFWIIFSKNDNLDRNSILPLDIYCTTISPCLTLYHGLTSHYSLLA